MTITSSDKIWRKVRDYAHSCSWKAGKSLAKLMDEDNFSDCYLVSDHENFYEKYGFTVIGRKMAP